MLRPWLRALAVWLVLIVTEIVHGTVRAIVLVPAFGDLRARQIGVFTGSGMNLGITYLFIRRIGAQTARTLAGIASPEWC